MSYNLTSPSTSINQKGKSSTNITGLQSYRSIPNAERTEEIPNMSERSSPVYKIGGTELPRPLNSYQGVRSLRETNSLILEQQNREMDLCASIKAIYQDKEQPWAMNQGHQILLSNNFLDIPFYMIIHPGKQVQSQ